MSNLLLVRLVSGPISLRFDATALFGQNRIDSPARKVRPGDGTMSVDIGSR